MKAPRFLRSRFSPLPGRGSSGHQFKELPDWRRFRAPVLFARAWRRRDREMTPAARAGERRPGGLRAGSPEEQNQKRPAVGSSPEMEMGAEGGEALVAGIDSFGAKESIPA